MARKKKKTLKDIMEENRRIWDLENKRNGETDASARTHNQMSTTVSPQEMLNQGHQIISHQYNRVPL